MVENQNDFTIKNPIVLNQNMQHLLKGHNAPATIIEASRESESINFRLSGGIQPYLHENNNSVKQKRMSSMQFN